MSIEKLKNGKYRAKIFQRSRNVANSPSFDKRRDAELWEAEHKRRALRGELELPQNTATIQEALIAYNEKMKGYTGLHRWEALYVLSKAIDALHINLVSEFTPRVGDVFLSDDTLSSWTKARYIQHLKTFGRFLCQKSYTREDPLAKLKKPAGRNIHERRALSDHEVVLVLRSVQKHAPQIESFCRFLLLSGCRKMEGVTLEWQDVDFENRTVFIHDKPHVKVKGHGFRCKWGSSRVIPMSDELRELLLSLPRSRGFVFQSQEGRLIDFSLRRFRRAVALSGIDRPKEVNLHSFRHTWITRLLANGIDLYSVMRYAGHRNISTTQRYLHGSNDKEKMALDAERFPKFATRTLPETLSGVG